MCQFTEAMERLKSSSNLSVANEEFSQFNKYMHIKSRMDEKLEEVIFCAKKKKKALVLVCGNSGDGKSHLIANFISRGIFNNDEFDIYIDATSSDKKGKRANEKLREKLDEFSDDRIENGSAYKLIVAINLGVLNDFIKNYHEEYTVLQEYVDKQGLFDNIPAWKSVLMENCSDAANFSFFGYVDFTSFHRFELGENGIDSSFFSELLGKIVSTSDENVIYASYKNGCGKCPRRDNCPVYSNYSELLQNESVRVYVIERLIKAIIKCNLLPSVREINDFFYEIIVGRTFDENIIMSHSVDRLLHFIKNQSLWLLFENSEGILQYVAREDILANPQRKCDKQIISLNLKPDFKKWIKETAAKRSAVFVQIYNDILYCESSSAKKYREHEDEIKQAVFKLYIRMTDVSNDISDVTYDRYLGYLYYYNIGVEEKCKDVIQLIEECIYLWNGRLGDRSGTNVKNGVITNRASSKYYLFKKMEVKFVKNSRIQALSEGEKLPYFSSTMRFGFRLKDKANTITLDIDYELYAFLLEVKKGFTPTNSDRKKNVKYDAFVCKMIAESDSDTYVYSRNDLGKTYRISKDDFDNYTFDNEV